MNVLLPIFHSSTIGHPFPVVPLPPYTPNYSYPSISENTSPLQSTYPPLVPFCIQDSSPAVCSPALDMVVPAAITMAHSHTPTISRSAVDMTAYLLPRSDVTVNCSFPQPNMALSESFPIIPTPDSVFPSPHSIIPTSDSTTGSMRTVISTADSITPISAESIPPPTTAAEEMCPPHSPANESPIPSNTPDLVEVIGAKSSLLDQSFRSHASDSRENEYIVSKARSPLCAPYKFQNESSPISTPHPPSISTVTFPEKPGHHEMSTSSHVSFPSFYEISPLDSSSAFSPGLQGVTCLVSVYLWSGNTTPRFPGNFHFYAVSDTRGLYICVDLLMFNSQIAFDMHMVWLNDFASLFSICGDHWALVPCAVGSPKPTQMWRTYTATAKVRFKCECGNPWTSMHGVVTFQYYLLRDSCCGTVMVQWPCQACSMCNSPAQPMWYPREVRRVLGDLRNRIFSKIYSNSTVKPLNLPRQFGAPRGCHRRDLCAGCHTGSCMNARLPRRSMDDSGDPA